MRRAPTRSRLHEVERLPQLASLQHELRRVREQEDAVHQTHDIDGNAGIARLNRKRMRHIASITLCVERKPASSGPTHCPAYVTISSRDKPCLLSAFPGMSAMYLP